MMDIAAASWWEILLRLILALVLGGLIGLERETVEKPAGLRTHTLVTLGAALFTLISKEGFFGSGADPARIASNIVVGIGFLGAGTIWRSGVNVQGLTTAAILHDTVEDTETTPEELARVFGQKVSDVVAEVTDDKSLPKPDRKRLQ